MELDQVLELIRDAWPVRLERGRITHVHRNHLQLPDGSRVHLRVMIQTVTPAEIEHATIGDDLAEN